MGLINLTDNEFIDVDKVNRFYLNGETLMVVTNSEEISISPESKKRVLMAIFRNDASKRITKQYTAA